MCTWVRRSFIICPASCKDNKLDCSKAQRQEIAAERTAAAVLKKKNRLQAFITWVIKSLIKHEFLSTQKGHASCSSFWNVCRFGTFPSIKDIYFDLCERAWTRHCFHYQLCILETTREHVKSKKIHWLLQHLPSCLPYTVRNDQFLNSLYWERIESLL